MNKYQMIIQFVPDINEETIDRYMEKAQEITELTRIDKWGKKKLVYPVRAKNKIWYYSANSVCCNIELNDMQQGKIKKLFDTQEIIKLIIVRSDKKWATS